MISRRKSCHAKWSQFLYRFVAAHATPQFNAKDTQTTKGSRVVILTRLLMDVSFV